MSLIPLLIIIFLVLIGVTFTYIFIYKKSNWNLCQTNLITHITQLWTCIAAFISATIVINGYIISSHTFILSQKPSLNIAITGKAVQDVVKDKIVHQTYIRYFNKSNNPFYDLTLVIRLKAPNIIIDLSDLFKAQMYMAAGDDRTRNFIIEDELVKHNIDFNSIKDSEITLFVEYKFTFNDKEELVHVQEYKWNKEREQWDIL